MAVTAAPTRQQDFGRVRPTASLALTSAFIAGHHWWAVTHYEIYTKLLLFLFMAAGFSLGGVIHPPMFYALTKWGGHLPTRMKVLGSVFGLAGFALGMYVLFTVYDPKF
jgi:hypothetical protein